MKERVEYLDIARGIGMTLVILGHSIGSFENPINRLILSFHMPLFFIISGFFYNQSHTNNNPLLYLKKQIKKFWYPQLTLSIGSIIISFLYCLYNGTHKDYSSIEDTFLYIFFGFWFLPVLFYVNIIMFTANTIKSNFLKYSFIIFTFFILFFLKRFGYIPLMQNGLCLSIVPMSLFFYCCGSFFYKLFNKKCPIEFLLILIISITIIISQINEPVLMYLSDYGNIFYFMISSILGSYLVIQVSILLNSKLMAWIGKNSIIIYVVHFWIINYVNTINLHIISFINHPNNYTILYALNFITTFTIALVSTNIINKFNKLKIFFGISN